MEVKNNKLCAKTRRSLLVHQANQIATNYTAANKNIMVGILLAEKALLKSPYVKR
jgi:hypothetical protein